MPKEPSAKNLNPTAQSAGAFSRRALLKGVLGIGAASLPLGYAGRVLKAASLPQATDPERRFIFCYFSGGWDILLSLDPRDPSQFNAGNKVTTRIEPAYDVIGLQGDPRVQVADNAWLGPYVGELAAHWPKLSVVRGMSMDTLTHEVGRRRFLTGRPPSGLLARGSSASTWMAAMLGGSDPIPNLSVRSETYNADLPTFATGLKVAGVSDLQRALREEPPLPSATQQAQLDFLLDQFANCPGGAGSPFVQSATASRTKAQEMAKSGYHTLFDFAVDTPSMMGLRAHFGFGKSTADLASPATRAALAGVAITSGLSRAVSVTVADGLDTHYDNWASNHGPNLQAGFNAVARLISWLEATPHPKGGNWLARTTLIGFSEFCRTPLLNANLGRDHWLTNACFLAGAGVQGGRIVGASSDVAMQPQRVNLVTGALNPSGDIVRPENVLQALIRSIGVPGDPADLRAEPFLAALGDP